MSRRAARSKARTAEQKDQPDAGPSRRRRFVRTLLALVAVAFILVESLVLVRWWRVQSHLQAAREAAAQAEFDSAIVHLARIDRMDSDRADVHFLYAVNYRRQDRFDRFVAHLEQAEALGWDPAEIERQRVLASAQIGDLGRVESQINDMFQEDLDDGTAEQVFEALAKGYLASYRLRDAWDCLGYWLDANPNAVLARLWRADISERMGDNTGAIADYQAVLDNNPDHLQANLRLGNLLLDTNQVEEAQVHFERCCRLQSTEVNSLLGLVRCAQRLGDEPRALEWAAQMLGQTLDSLQRANVLTEVGKIHLYNGDTEQSLTCLTEALQLAPDDGNVHYALGMALAQDRQTARAEYHMERSKQIKDRDNRLHDLTLELVQHPGDADRRFEVAMILWEKGHPDQAAAWVRTALQQDPAHGDSHRFLAQYHQGRGQLDLARDHLEQARLADANRVEAPDRTGTVEDREPNDDSPSGR